MQGALWCVVIDICLYDHYYYWSCISDAMLCFFHIITMLKIYWPMSKYILKIKQGSELKQWTLLCINVITWHEYNMKITHIIYKIPNYKAMNVILEYSINDMFCFILFTDIIQVQNMYFEFKSNNYKLLQVYIKTQ